MEYVNLKSSRAQSRMGRGKRQNLPSQKALSDIIFSNGIPHQLAIEIQFSHDFSSCPKPQSRPPKTAELINHVARIIEQMAEVGQVEPQTKKAVAKTSQSRWIPPWTIVS